MNLLAIKAYLSRVKISSLAGMANYFKCDQEILRCMLSHWVRKGRVNCFKKTAACGGACVKCDVSLTEIYEWVYTSNT